MFFPRDRQRRALGSRARGYVEVAGLVCELNLLIASLLKDWAAANRIGSGGDDGALEESTSRTSFRAASSLAANPVWSADSTCPVYGWA